MVDVALVRGAYALADATEDDHGLLLRDGAVRQPLAERSSPDVLHDDDAKRVAAPRVVDGADVRVLDADGVEYLLNGVAVLGHDLQGDRKPLEVHVPRLVDGALTPLTNLLDDLVLVENPVALLPARSSAELAASLEGRLRGVRALGARPPMSFQLVGQRLAEHEQALHLIADGRVGGGGGVRSHRQGLLMPASSQSFFSRRRMRTSR